MTRRDSIQRLLSIVFTLGLLAIHPVFAANDAPPISSAATTATCGATVEDNLAAARKALQSDDKAARAALACLLEATSALNDRLSNDEQGRPASGFLRFPTRTDVPSGASQ